MRNSSKERLVAPVVAFFLLLPAVAHAQPVVAHPWHGVDPEYDGKVGFRALIEIPRGSKNKYEVDKPTGLLKLDRVLRSDRGYPLDYGFIPRSYGDDHDPLDVVVLTSHPVDPLTIVPVRAIGVLKMRDQGEGDDKIIAVNTGDPVYGKLEDISQLDPAKLAEVKTFFETYKLKEGKVVEVDAPEGPQAARKVIARAFEEYAKLQASQKKGVVGSIKGFLGKAGSFLEETVAKLFVRGAPAKLPERKGMSDVLSERVADSTHAEARDGR